MKKILKNLWLLAAVCVALAGVSLQVFAGDSGIELPIIPGDSNHRYGEWVVEIPATCTEAGSRYCICSTCNKRKTETIPALGHNTVTDEAVAATCTATGLTEGSHCDRCGVVFVAQEETPVTEHPFGDWIITKDPTFTEEGAQEKVCSGCGETVSDALPILVGKVEKWNITLKDFLQVNLHVDISESIIESAKVEITFGESSVKHDAMALGKTEDGLYIASVNLAAAQMTEIITVRVLFGNIASEPASYTIRQYADTILADSAQSQYHDVVRKMLHYGAAAQSYFAYDASGAANADIPAVDGPEIPETASQEMQIRGKANGVTFHSVSLVHRQRIALRYYFQLDGDVTAYTFTAGGVSYTPQQMDDQYYIEIPGITPEKLDQQVTLEVTDSQGNCLTVAYSPLNYIVRMNTKGTDSLKGLLKTLYQYHLAAKELWLTN